jgi:ribonuclease P protein component
MKKRYRLRRTTDFEPVIAGGRIFRGRGLVGFARVRADGPSRVGVTVSRQVRGAVKRNRARRRLREAVRRRLLQPGSPLLAEGIGYDVVLIARPAALELAAASLEAEAEAMLGRLQGLPL